VNAVLGLPVATGSNFIRVGGVEHPHDTPPYPFMPSPTFGLSSVPGAGIRQWPPASNAAGVVTYISLPRGSDRFTDYEFYNVDGWDGYGALPISRETVKSARRFFLQIPRRFDYVDIAPGSDGTIGFEWRFGTGPNRSFILIDVGPGEVLSARKIDPSGKITSFSPTRVDTGAESLIFQLFHYPYPSL
jgi:hypothetical protein